MRLAEIVRVRDGQLPLPDAFTRPLGLYDGSKLYQSKVRGHEHHQILTTIPQDCWRRILRVSVLLEHTAGALDLVAEAISSLDASILVMEGYGREPDEEGWWSGIVQLPIPSSGVKADELSKAKLRIIEELYSIYEAPVQEDEFPFPKRLWPGDGHPRVERFEYGLRTSFGEAVVLVENMRLTVIADQVGEEEERKFKEESSSITVGKDIASDSKFVWGLLMCNTEERFLRFMAIKSPVEIRLQVATRSEDETRVGVGVLSELTRILKQAETGEKPGINIVYLFNYITERGWRPPGTSPNQGQGRPALIERSVIQCFLEPPPPWRISDVKKIGEIEKRWCAVFEALADARIDGERIVEWDGSRMTLWLGEKLTFILDKSGKAKPERWWMRMKRTSNLGAKVLFGIAGVLVAVSLCLIVYSPTLVGDMVGLAGLFLSGGTLLYARERRWER